MALRAVLSLLAGVALAAGDVAADEPLPVPRVAVPDPVLVIPYRVSHYEVWQHLAVDRQGFFRPRVLWTPHGAFYSYNGQPYPWLTSEPRRFMPYVTD
jgi:hypothetical protein